MRKIAPPYTDPAPLFRHGGARPAGRQGLLDFSASINPLGPPPSVLRALREALPEIAHYPDPECRELTERIAAYHSVDPSMVVVGNGSNELIYAIARAFRPKRVAIAEPTYTEYLRASLLVGAEVDHWLAEGEDFQVSPFDPEAAELVWLCDPNNPTGTGCSGDQRRWMAAIPNALFVVDEAFLPFCYKKFYCSDHSFQSGSLISEVSRLKNLIVLRSLTKLYALPGLRLGYAIASPEQAVRVRAQLVPWSVSTLAQSAGLAALNDTEFEDETNAWIADTIGAFNDTPVFAQALVAASDYLHPSPEYANFVLVRLEGITSIELTRRLPERGILIRDASNFVGLDDRYVRIAIRTPAENERLFAALSAVLRG